MSTRAIIAREVDSRTGKFKFKGRYHHSDGYPTGLGATLYDLYNGHFEKDLPAMLKYLLDDHPAGWSCINDCDFTLEPGYIKENKLSEAYRNDTPLPPRCFCHGDRNKEGFELTESDDTDTEWAYVFLKDRPAMMVLARKNDKWQPMGEVSLEKEVNWEHIECGENLEHCSHYAWVHNKTICRGCDGKGVRDAGGHQPGFGACSKSCVPENKAPKALRRGYKNWHVSKPSTGWTCQECAGTGKVQP